MLLIAQDRDKETKIGSEMNGNELYSIANPATIVENSNKQYLWRHAFEISEIGMSE